MAFHPAIFTVFLLAMTAHCFNVVLAQYEKFNVGKCQFPKHKHTIDTINKNALMRIQGLIGKSYRTTDQDQVHVGTDIFTYDVSICGNPKTAAENSTQGAVQFKAGSSAITVLGDVSAAEIMGGKNWVSLEYEGGKEYGSHCAYEPRRTLIMMICSPGESEGVFRLVEENNNKTADCFYLFELEHQDICDTSVSGLSTGSIIIIIFISLVAVYLVGGSIYQRFVVGAKGLEQIPNYHFWLDFGNLQADGCDLICRCGRRNTDHVYRGIGDDQLNNAPDRDDDYSPNHDDDLLPM